VEWHGSGVCKFIKNVTKGPGIFILKFEDEFLKFFSYPTYLL
jgi:hypothetical protein